jgi:hypothetical protein
VRVAPLNRRHSQPTARRCPVTTYSLDASTSSVLSSAQRASGDGQQQPVARREDQVRSGCQEALIAALHEQDQRRQLLVPRLGVAEQVAGADRPVRQPALQGRRLGAGQLQPPHRRQPLPAALDQLGDQVGRPGVALRRHQLQEPPQQRRAQVRVRLLGHQLGRDEQRVQLHRRRAAARTPGRSAAR